MPRLLDANLCEIRRLAPQSLSLEMNLRALSTAEMVLPGTPQVEVGTFLELFNQQGSTGIFRVEQAEIRYPAATYLTLKHALVTLADSRCVLSKAATAQGAPQLFREILSQQSMWQCGAIEAPDSLLVTPEGGGSLLEALEALLEALPGYRLAFDHSTIPWTMHLLALTEDCATECRLTRNLTSLTVETDRSQLCTQLYLPGIAQPLTADTASRWGIVSGQLSASANLTAEELTALGQAYLDQHKNPAVSITMDALDLCRLTGSALDSFQLGGMCRICLPESDTPMLQRMVTLSWPDVYGTPQVVRATLSTATQSTSSLLSGLIVSSTLVKKQVVEQGDELALQKEILLAAQEQITLLSQNITLHASEMLTLRSGIDDNAASITLLDGRIEANAQSIALKADKAALDLANGRIDAQANTIALKADKIDLQGYVTADSLETQVMSILADADIQGNLWVEDTLNAMYVQCTELYGDVVAESVTIGGKAAATQSWVSGRGYATQSWVNNKGYAVQGDINTAVNNVYNWVLENYATKSWVNANFQPKA